MVTLSRQINQLITVTLTRDSDHGLRPSSFTWRGSRYHVTAVLDCWEEAGRWWEQEPGQTVWRVEIRGGGVMELGQLHTEPPEWRLLVIYD